ncbi:MAG: restriction endonuclease subunit S, partial [Cuspidothrix sp.]
MGQSPVGTSYNLIGKGEPLLNGPTEFGSVYPTPVQWTSEPTRFAQPYDILFCVRGATTGRKNIADRNYCIGRGLAAIRGKEGETDTKFLMFLLDTVTDSLLKETAGSTFPNLPGEKLERFEIPLPPLAEQKRIAAILNEQMEAVEKARKATEAQLEAAKELPAAYLRAVFVNLELQQCKKRKLGEVCELVGGMQPPKSAFINNPQAGYVRLVQIQDFRRSDMAVYIPENEAKRNFDESDVMIGRYGPPVFQILRGLSGSYNVALMKAEPKPDLLKDYLYYL